MVHAALYDSQGWVPLQKIVAAVSVETGLVPSRTLEYLQLLNDNGHFKLDIAEGKIKKVLLVEEERILEVHASEVSGEQS